LRIDFATQEVRRIGDCIPDFTGDQGVIVR
jgi:hypothetical protein